MESFSVNKYFRELVMENETFTQRALMPVLKIYLRPFSPSNMLKRGIVSNSSRIRFSTKTPKGPSLVPEPKKGDSEIKPRAYSPPTPKLDLIKDETPYVPQERYQRVNFEYPNEPNSHKNTKGTRSRFRSLIPIGIALTGGAWALYTFNFFTDPTPNEYLHPNKFIPFVITNKVDLDKDHYLLELTPQYSRWKTTDRDVEPFNGNKLWHIEIKQPQIMVLRKYTPLPLEIFTSQDGKPIIRIQDPNVKFSTTQGKLVFYIKKYDQGEVARWIHKRPIGSILELRGPFTDYSFPKTLNNNFERPGLLYLPSKIKPDPVFPIKPDNLAFFAAGTGIAPVLQLLFSKNPYKGFIDVYYSHKTESEVPFATYLFFLEKLDRAKFHHFVQSKNEGLKPRDIPKPTRSNWIEYQERLESEQKTHERLVAEKLEQLKNQRLNPKFPQTHKDETSVSQKLKTSPKEEEQPDKKYSNALQQAEETRKLPKKGPSLAFVCGPDGYVKFLAGPKPFDSQGPLGGLLKEKGWNESQVYKLD